MKNKLLMQFESRVLAKVKRKLPEFRTGDTIRVHYKIQEGSDASKFRLQPFEGIVTRFRKGVIDGSFTVRKIAAGGVGVERVFPIASPYVEKVDVLAKGAVRRARLYYLRDLSGKAARIRSRYLGKALEATATPNTETAETAAAPAAE